MIMERLFWVLLVCGVFWWLGPIPAIAIAVFLVECVFEGFHAAE